ncbi:uncharacterized protein AKAME5_001174000 [Lates japonicus]|uniref:Uncharacterized protein n=1 Tax=Lates japonicus TaxID=270547 RepID=A0AAD3R8M5_LATJO|nr:uncharacterized protein AKAME5_001174000 [Lates japonicus]
MEERFDELTKCQQQVSVGAGEAQNVHQKRQIRTHLGTREEMRRCHPGPPFLLTSAERDQRQEPEGPAGLILILILRQAGHPPTDRWGTAHGYTNASRIK